MARSTAGREARTVLGVRRCIVLCHVTGGTLRRNPNVLTRCVAIRTEPRQVSARQRKRRLAVIE